MPNWADVSASVFAEPFSDEPFGEGHRLAGGHPLQLVPGEGLAEARRDLIRAPLAPQKRALASLAFAEVHVAEDLLRHLRRDAGLFLA